LGQDFDGECVEGFSVTGEHGVTLG
jgi:hypothetical protein